MSLRILTYCTTLLYWGANAFLNFFWKNDRKGVRKWNIWYNFTYYLLWVTRSTWLKSTAGNYLTLSRFHNFSLVIFEFATHYREMIMALFKFSLIHVFFFFYC